MTQRQLPRERFVSGTTKPRLAGAGLVAITVGLAFVLSACGGGSAGAGDGSAGGGGVTYKVGFVAPLSGPVSSTGTWQQEGARIAVAEINESGFLGKGKRIQLLEENSEGDPAKAIAAMNKLLSQGAVSVLGGTLSGEAGVMKPRSIQNKVPLIVLSSLLPSIPELPFVYRPLPLPLDPGGPNEQVAKLLAGQGVRTAVISVTADNEGQVNDGKSWELYLKNAGVRVLTTVSANNGDTNLAGPASKAIDMNPDLVVNSMLPGQNSLMVKTLADLGFHGKTAAYQSLATTADYKIAGKALDGVIVASPFSSDAKWEVTKTFTKRFDAAYHRTPNILNAMGYSSAWFLAQGMKDAADASSAASIAEALAKIKTSDSVYGPVNYKDGQAHVAADLPLLVWKGDGTLVAYQ